MAAYGAAAYGSGVYGPDITAPTVPTGLTITVGVGQVTLDWADNTETDIADYLVVQSTDDATGWSYAPGSPVVASTLTVTGLAAGTTYHFRVAARDTFGNTSAYTASASGTPTALVPAPHPALKPPLDLSVEVTQPDGRTFIWDSTAVAGDIPQGVTFRTRRGDGFADGAVSLPRRIDRDYVDVALLDSFAFIGADGSVAYEGRLGAAPRSMGDTHSITCQLAGWMSHAKDRKFTDVYVDRDFRRWREMSTSARVSYLDNNRTVHAHAVHADSENGKPILETPIAGSWVSPWSPICEAWYDIGSGNNVGAIYYAWERSNNVDGTNTAYEWQVSGTFSDTADGGANTGTGNLRSTAASGTGTLTLTETRRYVRVRFAYNATPGGADGGQWHVRWTSLAVYGDHGLTRRGDNPGGLYASDVITHIANNYAPRLNTSGVQATSYPIPHLAFHEHAFPYDALLDINKYHLWELAVWENRTLHYTPHDLTDYDWEVRLSDHGVTVDLQGDSSEDLANGILVTYQDAAKGTQHTLEPPDHAELRDDDPLNPANRAGLEKWTEVRLSSPSTQDAALQIGRTILAEHNQPKAPGTINVRGHIRDRAGNWQQVWKVRAGDTVAITDHPNSRPRLIMETTYNHDRHDLTIAVDATMRRTDALLDRQATALVAANL